jgi:hypothetical protein
MSACAHDADPSTGPVSKDDMVAIDLTETVHTEVVEPPKQNGGVKKSNGAPHAVSPSFLLGSGAGPEESSAASGPSTGLVAAGSAELGEMLTPPARLLCLAPCRPLDLPPTPGLGHDDDAVRPPPGRLPLQRPELQDYRVDPP